MAVLGKRSASHSEREEHRKEISRWYIKFVRELSDDDLSLILQEAELGIQGRDESTIQEILDELSIRILLRDNSNDKNLSINT